MLNLTPHAITVRTEAGDISLPPSGEIARVAVNATDTGERILGVPVVSNRMGPVTGLQRDSQGKICPCIVSTLVLAALPPGTPGVYAPDTGATAIRDDRGQIVAVTRFVTA